MCPTPRRQLASHPARHGLTFQRRALPVSGSSFSLGLNYPALLLRSQGTLRPPVPSLSSLPRPQGGRGVNGHGGGRRLCARVCYRGQNTVLSGSQRMLSLGFRNEGQRKKKTEREIGGGCTPHFQLWRRWIHVSSLITPGPGPSVLFTLPRRGRASVATITSTPG